MNFPNSPGGSPDLGFIGMSSASAGAANMEAKKKP